MFSLPDDDQLWLLILNLHQEVASGLLGRVPSVLHLDHQLIGDIGCQGVSEKGDGRSWRDGPSAELPCRCCSGETGCIGRTGSGVIDGEPYTTESGKIGGAIDSTIVIVSPILR